MKSVVSDAALRRPFSSQKFCPADVVNDLRAGTSLARNELVARSVFYYDKCVRESSGVRYLQLSRSAVSSFNRYLDDGFQPDFNTYAGLCDTPEDAKQLADVCSRVLSCVSYETPVKSLRQVVNERGSSAQKASYRTELNYAHARCDYATEAVFCEALSDVYMTLGSKSPDLLKSFLSNLDNHTIGVLQRGVSGRLSPERSKIASAFISKYGADSFKRPPSSFTAADRRESYFYDWSFIDRDPYFYVLRDAGFRSDFSKAEYSRLSKSGDEAVFAHNGLSRAVSHEKGVLHSAIGVMCRQIFADSPGFVPSRVEGGLDRFYERYGRDKLRNELISLDKSAGRRDISMPLQKKLDVTLQDVFGGCSDDLNRLTGEIPVMSDICNQTLDRIDGIAGRIFEDPRVVDSIQQTSANTGRGVDDIMTRMRESCVATMTSHAVTHTLYAYEAIREQSPDNAKLFMDSLSDDMYSRICSRNPVIFELCPRESVNLHEAENSDAIEEVIDDAGLAENKVLNDSRTQILLDAGAYRELLSACMYRYEFDSYIGKNELNAYTCNGLSGKAPNETFKHIASNCRTPEDAMMLSRIVNIACDAYHGVDDVYLSAGSVLQEDVRSVLCDSGIFKTDALRNAFASGLSPESVKQLDVGSMLENYKVDASLRDSLSKTPVIGSDDDILHARQSGFRSITRWFSKSSAEQSVSRAAESARESFFDDSNDVFRNAGALATACCSAYADAVRGITPENFDESKRIGLHAVIGACDSADNVRGAARVCNIAFDALSDHDSIGLLSDLTPEQIDKMRAAMQSDVMQSYEKLPDRFKPAFVAGLFSPAREEILSDMPGAWSNGIYLQNIPRELGPAPGYANRLGAFNCPSFSEPVSCVRQPVFVDYQANVYRGQTIRNLIRVGCDDTNPSSADAIHMLTSSCLATYQDYGRMADAESRGHRYSASSREPTYSLYELAEQCNPDGRRNSMETLKVFSKAYCVAMDSLADSDGKYHAGMRYAIKTDMARSLKFLESAGLADSFVSMHSHTKYEHLLREAMADMPVYINSDAPRQAGRRRPFGAKDIKDTMSTMDCIRSGLESAGKFSEIEYVNATYDAYAEVRRKSVLDGVPASKRSMDDLDRACSDIEAGALSTRQEQLGD